MHKETKGEATKESGNDGEIAIELNGQPNQQTETNAQE